jgi:ribokinase
VQLAKLAGRALFLTALGRDEVGDQSEEQLSGYGVEVAAARRDASTRRAVTFLDANGERTITTIGPRPMPRADDPLPWERLAELDGVYFTGGDVGALRAARAARVLVVTPRARRALEGSGVEVDALVRSGRDAGEQGEPEKLGYSARLVVTTEGGQGGTWVAREGRSGRFKAAPLPGPVADAYGAGDSFAAAFTYGLAAGMDVEQALEIASRCGAANITGRGPYTGQLDVAAIRLGGKE